MAKKPKQSEKTARSSPTTTGHNTTSTTSTTTACVTATAVTNTHITTTNSTIVSDSSIPPAITTTTTTSISNPPRDIAQSKGDPPKPTGIKFSLHLFGSSKRSFQASWYANFKWLEYFIERDAAFCYPCRFFGVSPNPALVSTGFRDGKNAKGSTGILSTHHEKCSTHHDAILSWNLYKDTFVNNSSVAVHIERGRHRTIEDNRIYIKSIIECILFCCQQGLALRGHREVIDYP
uniref:TTF-type domain-containing protein n=2 Tax=Amphimedon queenslandica TaxID=400682 RepID=A0A1X7SJW7_AMPQE